MTAPMAEAAERVRPRAPLVLIVDDDADVRWQLGQLLVSEGFRARAAADGEEALRLAREERPDLVLLDQRLPGLSGDEVHEALRADFRTRFIPVVFLTAEARLSDKVERLIAGADDYITKPFALSELVARVRGMLRRAATLRGLNPLSGFPGNAAIDEELARRLASGEALACLHVDVDEFKSYNDHYGFARGDAVIQALARAVVEAVEAAPSGDHFIGHVGGDDFVVVTDASLGVELARRIVERFDAAAPPLHDLEDRERGWYEATDRRGNRLQVPTVSISIGVAVSNARAFAGPADIAHTAAETKEVAKRTRGSSWAIDRRHGGRGP
ncbi:MAG: GGDEF domain-containing response regulator [Candidatus Limnocylindria bacterium]